jgi:cytochrome oxidase Cu insertion factor (SCO1/SenC/PrrC family)
MGDAPRVRILRRLTMALVAAACVALIAGAASAEGRVAASAEEVRPLSVGDPAPHVTLRDLDGRDVALASLWGEKPVVLVFYRGGW